MTPPLGLITVAALCPPTWTLRLLDHAFDELRDEDLRWADLVMVSAMHAQRADAVDVLSRARALGRERSSAAPGPAANRNCCSLEADHVMVGEAEEVFADIAAALEQGTAHAVLPRLRQARYVAQPGAAFRSAAPDKYTSMPVQFSRGCPFQCEFCDIITIYGRKPRMKTPAQLIAELDTLRGWAGATKSSSSTTTSSAIRQHALQLARELAVWQRRHKRPVFVLYRGVDRSGGPARVARGHGGSELHVRLHRHRDAFGRKR